MLTPLLRPVPVGEYTNVAEVTAHCSVGHGRHSSSKWSNAVVLSKAVSLKLVSCGTSPLPLAAVLAWATISGWCWSHRLQAPRACLYRGSVEHTKEVTASKSAAYRLVICWFYSQNVLCQSSLPNFLSNTQWFWTLPPPTCSILLPLW